MLIAYHSARQKNFCKKEEKIVITAAGQDWFLFAFVELHVRIGNET